MISCAGGRGRGGCTSRTIEQGVSLLPYTVDKPRASKRQTQKFVNNIASLNRPIIPIDNRLNATTKH